MKQLCAFRTEQVGGKDYIFLPLPFLTNENDGELVSVSGYALDVDDDFVIYPFVHDFKQNRVSVLYKEQHCVQKEFKWVDNNGWESEIVEVNPEDSAV